MVREVSYKVIENKIEPANKQWLGMQREDCATKVLFDVSKISKISNYSDYTWRIDFDQASAGYSPGTPIENSGSTISRDLPYDMTRFGGDVQITVVGSKDGEIVYSIPARGYLTAVSQSEPSENETAIDISSAEISAKKSAYAAAESEEKAKASEERSAEYEATAQTAKTAAEEMIKSFEEETEFVFLGGDARNVANTDLVVDNVLTPYTKNPVEGGVIYNYIKENSTLLKLELLDAIYPVGSIYMSSVNTNPSKLFGGTWQRIKDAFILAKGDGIGAGTSGGKKDVVLKVANLPAHSHGVEPSAGGVTYTDYQFTVNKVMESDSIARRKVASGSDYEVMSALPGTSDYRTNDITAAAKTASVGNGEAFEIIPPFITKYVWERTA